MAKKFYICKICGNLVEKIHDSGVTMVCCGQNMTELVPNTSDGAGEKHVPVVTVKDGAVHVNVGEADHPMTEEHSILWIQLETDKGSMRKTLKPGEKPCADFNIGTEKPLEVFAYCNLHGLWKTEIK